MSKPEQVVAIHEDRSQVAATQQSETNAIISIIERAARDQSVDIEKMMRLLDMRDRVMSQQAKIEFNAAFARMQPELPAIEKKGKSNNGAYGKWEDIQGGIQPVIARHGFSLSFKTAIEADAITVTAILHHAAGHDDSTDMRLPIDKSGSKNNVQAVGSSVSYGKRYAACALLNIRVGGEDDDGQSAGGEPAITEDQVIELLEIAESQGRSRAALCKRFAVEKLTDIRSSKFDEVRRILIAAGPVQK